MLKKILIFLTALYFLPLGFYFWAVLPACLACNTHNTDAERIDGFVTDFWGQKVQCMDEEPDFYALANQFSLLILGIFGVLLLLGWLYWFKRKKNL